MFRVSSAQDYTYNVDWSAVFSSTTNVCHKHLHHPQAEQGYQYNEPCMEGIPQGISQPAVVAGTHDNYLWLPERVNKFLSLAVWFCSLLLIRLALKLKIINREWNEGEGRDKVRNIVYVSGLLHTYTASALSSRTVDTPFLCCEIDCP